jgi:hypothetical protein
MHFGTWILSEEPIEEPVVCVFDGLLNLLFLLLYQIRLIAAVKKADLDPNSFVAVKIGEWFT